jgi:hypothetical protein
MVSRWGKDLSELPVTRAATDEGQYELDLMLTSVARGEFMISINATAGEDGVRALVPFRVVR